MERKVMKKKQAIPRSIKRAYPNVTSIIDAKHLVKIHVSARDCKSGEAMNPSECALAKAIKREFKADAAIVGLGASYIIKGNKATRFHTPERIRREIVSFDRHSDFAEGDYVLTRKSPSVRLGMNYHPKRYNDKRKRHDRATVKHITSPRVRVFSTNK
jgi:hypothetical protein